MPIDRYILETHPIGGSEAAAKTLPGKLMQYRIVLINIIAIGSWILREYVEIRFKRMFLVDPKA